MIISVEKGANRKVDAILHAYLLSMSREREGNPERPMVTSQGNDKPSIPDLIGHQEAANIPGN